MENKVYQKKKMMNSEYFGTSNGLADKFMSSLSKKWTSLSDIVCFGKHSYNYVVSHFAPNPPILC